MSKYHDNKAAAVTFNTAPTLTDQSQAKATDINIIMTQFMRTGQTHSHATPIYGDFSDLPTDLRGFIEMGRSLDALRDQLPKELQALPVEDLVKMNNQQIMAILTPVQHKDDKPKDEPK